MTSLRIVGFTKWPFVTWRTENWKVRQEASDRGGALPQGGRQHRPEVAEERSQRDEDEQHEEDDEIAQDQAEPLADQRLEDAEAEPDQTVEDRSAPTSQEGDDERVDDDR